jgi:hypothetical protein
MFGAAGGNRTHLITTPQIAAFPFSFDGDKHIQPLFLPPSIGGGGGT